MGLADRLQLTDRLLRLRREPSGERWRLELGRTWRDQARALAEGVSGA